MTFGQWLKTERIKRNQSQDELAALTGYTQAASDEADELAARIRRLGERDRALLLAMIGEMEK